jgi:molybdopterin converting factor small subunit
MKLTVEFLGLSRRLAQTRETLVELDDRATFRDVLRHLATRFPALLDQVILPQTYALVSSHMINIDGRSVVSDLDTQPLDGQRLIFMFVEAGG